MQIKLSEVEAPLDLKILKSEGGGGGGTLSSNHSPFKSTFESSLKRGEREKQLEILLQKNKKEKDKAIKLIVQIIGKDRISNFLARNAGAPDILDKLLEHFGDGSGSPSRGGGFGGGDFGSSTRGSVASQSDSYARSRSPDKGMRTNRSSASNNNNHSGGKSKDNVKSPMLYRSRIDEYYRSTISGRDI